MASIKSTNGSPAVLAESAVSCSSVDDVSSQLAFLCGIAAVATSIFVAPTQAHMVEFCLVCAAIFCGTSIVLRAAALMRRQGNDSAKCIQAADFALLVLMLVLSTIVAARADYELVVLGARVACLVGAVRLHTKNQLEGAIEGAGEVENRNRCSMSSATLAWQALRFLGQYKIRIAFLFSTALCAASFHALNAYIAGALIDENSTSHSLSPLAVLLLGNFLLREANSLLGSYTLAGLVAKAARDIQRAVFDYVCISKEDMEQGFVMSTFSGSVARIQMVWINTYFSLLVPSIRLFLALSFLAASGPTGISLACIYIAGLLYIYALNCLTAHPSKKSAAYFKSLGSLQTSLQNAYEIKGLISFYKIHGFMREKTKPLVEESCVRNRQQVFASSLARIAYDSFGVGFLVLATISIVARSRMSSGEIFSAIGYANACVSPTTSFGSFMCAILSNSKAIQDINALYDKGRRLHKGAKEGSGSDYESVSSSESGPTQARAIKPSKVASACDGDGPQEVRLDVWDTPGATLPTCGAVIANNVAFRQPSSSKPQLENVCVDFKPGVLHAIVGKSGCGKTTLLNLIAGILEPTEGKVQQPIGNISYMFQHSSILLGTVAENIAFGCGPNERDIHEAAKLAEIHDYIMSLPDKYETVLCSDSTRLSGGQLQRICLARALYRKPKVLLLDEVTSALDPSTEREVLQRLRRVTIERNLVTVLVTHSAAAYQAADELIVLHRGAVVQRGPYQKLARSPGRFRKFASSHSTARTPEGTPTRV